MCLTMQEDYIEQANAINRTFMAKTSVNMIPFLTRTILDREIT
jgi:hypothetical protein